MAPSAIEVDHINEIIEKEPTVHVEHNIDDHVAFGGDDQWFYNSTTRRFDLSRGASKRLIVDADDGIRNHRGVEIDPSKALLVIVDMQNFFIHPSFRDHSEGIKTVKPLINVIEKCRREGIQVCWLNWGINEYDLKVMPPAVTRGFNKALSHEKGHGWHVGLGSQLPPEQGGERCLFKGTWNADIYDPLLPYTTPEDVRFDKARMSGLWSPELPMHKWLRESGKKTLLFAGVNTDQCLLGTLTDAYSWGWDCILIGDCAGTMTDVMGTKEVCDYNIATNMGFVTDSGTFCAAPTTG
ncbi:isochorismatase hydrolase [Hortaea werneckii]|uniref:Isochorismatase-like domain-containing protein n=2 Tax=Hortaea werneckii TaxID=91943 RepID=A0A3M7JBZ7_HORWE|nr:isochorismatase hydrolase [Hortaea werneckii]OTA36229.1 hypothetical protein BTJ68_05415 [Hortaea werneckii EXF-2000]KAI6813139.1 isochorismatase hydrolase [Hortaea werneckii]KAI6815785.1 isochorismatase hydrolase [Hortaea werneckii]KAI6911238.1 isochorismatase hydrolase [Hortaea werneckii]